ncbi:MAG: FAD-dependent oxidoreductase [Candidatus Marinimicrobia bacterium]|nr:FAD-dependent oxidoreductase [Candidatus Neomarinimicrobiota bacterium]
MAYRTNAMICTCTNCISNGALHIKDALEAEISKRDLTGDIQIVPTGASGLCVRGPILIVQPDGIFYQYLKDENITELVEEHFLKGRPVKALMYTPPGDVLPIPKMRDIPFFKGQRLIALRNRGLIDPDNIDEYIANDGYRALAKVLSTMTPEDVITEVKKSGLRGRGGAGFPTGKKWELCRQTPVEPKYIICNADEGDPGAFMDRSILEADPHSILEGMTIGAYAIGAQRGYIYIRIEYPLAIKRLAKALKDAHEYGLLGKDIFGTGFAFDIEIFRGAGAFVCGEETALMASIESRPPEPRQRPPFPAQRGLFGKPTNINNVETWANIPVIINWGADWFVTIGTETCKGTKVFSLAGNINNAGLVEVPMGITLREIIYNIGGGIPGGKQFKAVQTGGPSGGFIPGSLLDIPVDYEQLQEAGSIMGSGGMVVLDENSCTVDMAKYFLEFTRDESCGKCVSCREGSIALLEIINRITEGQGREDDLELLEDLCAAIENASQCGLGQTLPKPVLSTLRNFHDEYIDHIKYKRCSALVCKQIISSACQYTCPLSQDVPCYVGLIAQGNFVEAIKMVRKENPFPLICGRVCTNPCELNCKAGDGSDPIAIRLLKRFLADYEYEHDLYIEEKPKAKREEKVAIIGSGPGGLTCGYYLALEGYQVTVFESQPVPGGMLVLGIPEFRLPRAMLNFEIDNVRKAGVNIQTGVTVGKDITLDQLREDYNAIYIGAGAHKSLRMGILGEETTGVQNAVEFLRAFNTGQKVEIGEKVVVVGGGNSAIDAARVINRLGKDARIIYRRTIAEMPAIRTEIEGAIAEGIDIRFLTNPVRVLLSNGRVQAVECIAMQLGDVDKSGRRKPVPVPDSEFTIDADTLIMAISTEPDLSFIPEDHGFQISGWNTLEVNRETLETGIAGIFAGGDVVTSPNTVAEAIGHGKLAARMIDKYIRGEKLEREYTVTRPALRVDPTELTDDEIEQLKKPEIPLRPVSERVENFSEVELGFTEAQAVAEAKRCLRCDLEIAD